MLTTAWMKLSADLIRKLRQIGGLLASCSAFPRGRGMRFLQLFGALFTAHLDRLAADLDLDGISIQLVVASCTSLL